MANRSRSSSKRPVRKRHIPINVVRPSKRRIKIDHVKATVRSAPVLPPCDSPAPQEQDEPLSDLELDDVDLGYDGDVDDHELTDVSMTVRVTASASHTERKRKVAEKWSEIRGDALQVVIEGMCPPACVKCCVCDKLCEDIVKCTDCGPSHYYCRECCVKLHLTALYHHCPEIWMV